MISVKEYLDGVGFYDEHDEEIAFYSFLIDKITFIENKFNVNKLKFIYDVSKFYKERYVENLPRS